MSTTWVFVGLLAGSEIAISICDVQGKDKPIGRSLQLISRDAGYALIGLAVSKVLAVSINAEIKGDIGEFIFG